MSASTPGADAHAALAAADRPLLETRNRSLLLLGVTLRSVGGSAEGSVVLAQSGLAGMGLFVVVLLAGEMANRLAREELAARGSLAIARQQAQLNRLVIEELADGVLVVMVCICIGMNVAFVVANKTLILGLNQI